MRYLLFNWENVGHTEDAVDDPSDLSNEEFENLAQKHGAVFESTSDFESGFNSELFSTHTHQLRIINLKELDNG